MTTTLAPFARIVSVLLLLAASGCKKDLPAPATPASDRGTFRDPDLPLERRLDNLVKRLTLEEKASQLVDVAPAIPRLGIPAYNWWNEALHGLARTGLATVFPQAIGLGATWDRELVLQMATVISDETRAKYHDYQRRGKRDRYQGLTLWSPNINLFRDPRWGRGMETYGEDPHLAGQLGAAFIKGLQGQHPRYLKTVATAKHYAVHSGPEPDRHSFDAVTDERDLRETYLPHFRTAVEAGVFSVMCAYNRYKGEAACGSKRLLTDILRGEWGFAGFVVSDCGAIRDFFKGHDIVKNAAEAAALGVRSGCDLSCGPEYKSLGEAVRAGLITEGEIDGAVRRVFSARFKLGMFDPDDRVPWSRLPLSVVDSPAHAQLALEAARKSIVLLKNEKGTLPLGQGARTIAVVGPLADDPYVALANYHGVPSKMITIRQGIEALAPQGTKVLYAPGAPIADGLPVLEPVPASALRGVRGAYFKNRTLQGEPALVRAEKTLDFMWWDKGPAEGWNDDEFSVRWEGELLAPETGHHAIGVRAQLGVEVSIDGKLVRKVGEQPETQLKHAFVELRKGTVHKLRIDAVETSGDASFQLFWSVPGTPEQLRREAVAAARQADVVVAVLGLTPWLEGEEMKVAVPGFQGGDRLTLDLPGPQQALLEALAAAGKPVVLVLLGGGALAVSGSTPHVPAIVEAWYPGQAGGRAVAEVLFGAYNPGGRLPITFYRSVDDLPPFSDYNIKGHTYRYFEGPVLYPFGHGLSYTRFAYRNLVVPATVDAGQPAEVSVTIENVGTLAGDEVVQLYVRRIGAPVPVPLRSLRAFERIHLGAGATKRLSFTLSPDDMALVDDALGRVVPPGKLEVHVGGKQPGAPGDTTQSLGASLEVRGPARLLESYRRL